MNQESQPQNREGGELPEPEVIAALLRRPAGEMAGIVAEKMNESNLLMNRRSIEKLDVKSGQRILEIGPGNGKFVSEILETDRSLYYTGIDYSEEMTRAASDINQRYTASGRARFLTGEADDLPFDDGTFHHVMTVNTVYFWENPEEVLAEIRRVLKPEGQLVIGIRPKAVMEKYPFTKYGFTLYSPDGLSELLKRNGFTVIENNLEKEPEIELYGEKFIAEYLIVRAVPNRTTEN